MRKWAILAPFAIVLAVTPIASATRTAFGTLCVVAGKRFARRMQVSQPLCISGD